MDDHGQESRGLTPRGSPPAERAGCRGEDATGRHHGSSAGHVARRSVPDARVPSTRLPGSGRSGSAGARVTRKSCIPSGDDRGGGASVRRHEDSGLRLGPPEGSHSRQRRRSDGSLGPPALSLGSGGARRGDRTHSQAAGGDRERRGTPLSDRAAGRVREGAAVMMSTDRSRRLVEDMVRYAAAIDRIVRRGREEFFDGDEVRNRAAVEHYLELLREAIGAVGRSLPNANARVPWAAWRASGSTAPTRTRARQRPSTTRRSGDSPRAICRGSCGRSAPSESLRHPQSEPAGIRPILRRSGCRPR